MKCLKSHWRSWNHHDENKGGLRRILAEPSNTIVAMFWQFDRYSSNFFIEKLRGWEKFRKVRVQNCMSVRRGKTPKLLRLEFFYDPLFYCIKGRDKPKKQYLRHLAVVVAGGSICFCERSHLGTCFSSLVFERQISNCSHPQNPSSTTPHQMTTLPS